MLLALATGALGLGSSVSASAATRKLRITAVSTKPRYVTGGDVLVRVRNATSTPTFSVGAKALPAHALGIQAWLVSDLPMGSSRIKATAGDAKTHARRS